MEAQYKVLNPLEHGPECSVYLISDTWRSNSNQVLSLLPKSHSYTRVQLEEFFLHRQSLDHPLLPRVTDITLRGNRLGMVSDCLPGPSFGHRKPRLHMERLRTIALHLAELLQFLHCRRFYAGYLTPSKLFLDEEGGIRVSLRWPGELVTKTSPRVDSIRYCAPELMSEPNCGIQADTYSLGMLFYFLFTGKHPFSEHDPNALKQKQLVAYPPMPRKISPDIPAEIESLILAQIQKNPDRRPPLSEIITNLSSKESTAAAPVPRFRSVLVGRKEEMRLFREICGNFAEHPRPRIITIGGTSGIGKTFLAKHFETTAKFMGLKTIAIQHHAADTSGEAFRQLHQLQPASGSDIATFIHKTIDSIRELSRSGSLLIRVENLQWVDPVSLKIYRGLMLCPDAEILIIGDLFLGEISKDWKSLCSILRQTNSIIELTLQPLTASDVCCLVSNICTSESQKGLASYLMTNCGGTPSYIDQLLSALGQSDQLIFEMGRWTWDAAGSPLVSTAPQTITQALKKSLAKLSLKQRRMLDFLALVDRPVPFRLLEKSMKENPDDFSRNAQLLTALHYVNVQGELSRPEISLSYEWLRVILLIDLPSHTKRCMHLSIAEVLEEELGQAVDPYLTLLLAAQLIEAGSKAGTQRYLSPALKYLRNNNQFREASSLLQMAESAGTISFSEPEFLQHHVELLYLCGQLDECEKVVKKVVRQDCTRKQKGSLLSLLGRIQISRSQNAEGSFVLNQALSALGETPDAEVHAEIYGDLLSLLSCTGNNSSARQVAAKVLLSFRQNPSLAMQDKLYHALYLYYCFAEGRFTGEAMKWERKSVHQAFKSGHLVRCVGRIFNIASGNLRIGKWNTATRLTRYCERVASQIGNLELSAYVKTNHLVQLRKEGKHLEAKLGLCRLLSRNRQPDRNPHLECEWQVELAKNNAYILELESALQSISSLDALPAIEKFTSTIRDSTLLKGWILLLLGEPEQAKQVVAELGESIMQGREGRLFLLSGQAKLALQDFEGALEDAKLALGNSPKSVPYYRTRARLLQAEILLAAPYLGEAGPYITDALAMSKRGFYAPLLARAYTLRGSWLSQKGDPGNGRVHCLRALQVARKVERPGLRAEIFRTLGRIEASRGRRERSDEHFGQALQILEERYLHLSPKYREKFAETHLEPVERERSRLSGRISMLPPRSLIHSRDLMRTLIFTDHQDLPSTLMESVRKVSPLISANLFLRSNQDNTFQLVARRGQCRHSGRHLLPMLQRKCPAEPRVVSDRSGYSVAVPLNTRERLEGYLYVERGGEGISEVEFDSLSSIADTGGLYLNGQTKQIQSKIASGRGLELEGGRRIIGSSPALTRMLNEIDKVARVNATVLIEGETGTGKELVAKAIHEKSGRQRSRYRPLNCSALSQELVESELFGYVRGAFTGATQDKKGLFEAASGGTLFLDEVSTLPLSLQSRLLRVLEEKKIRRVGDTRERAVDTRIVAATNERLSDLVQEGRFRADLFHRLNVFRIELPPLRERLTDIDQLCRYFLSDLCVINGQHVSISSDAISRLKTYHFPGNVRELRNLLENLFHTCRNQIITGAEVVSRLLEGDSATNPSSTAHLNRILDHLVSGHGDFWRLVRDPFLNRDLSRKDVQWIVAEGLETCGGSYRKLVEHFGMSPKDYKRFLAFLSNHDCKVDFRLFRRRGNYGPLKKERATAKVKCPTKKRILKDYSSNR